MKHGILSIRESEVEDIESWLGTQLDLVVTTWNEGQWGLDGITWGDSDKRATLERVFGRTDRQLVLHYEFQGGNLTDYSSAADGTHDDKHRQLARELIEIGMEDTIIRPSGEFNLDWSGRYPNDPSNYAEGLARVVREMRSVDGAAFTFTFSPDGAGLGVAPEAWPVDAPSWPSGADEPTVCPTLYDTWYGYTDGGPTTQAEREQAWEEVQLADIGRWEEFAQARNTTVAGTFEWGGMGDGTPFPSASGYDNPYFIRKMFDYGRDNGWEYQTYWNNNYHTIYPRGGAGLEEASDRFRDLVNERSGSSAPSTGDETTDPSGSDGRYGGYNTPSEGVLNWHIPLNENFTEIETDVQDLAARIDRLEDQL
jgi:hypothetical protein